MNYTIKCNTCKKQKKFIQISGRIELPHTKPHKGDLYELPPSYHRRVLLYTKFYNDGLSYGKIAELIGRSPSTVSREINCNRTHMNVKLAYYPHTAQKKYLLRHSYCHRGMFHSQEVISYIEEKLLATWSPEQIANTPPPIPMPSWRTIYRWLYDRYLLNGNTKVLRRKGKTHGIKETRGKFSKGKSIRKRDKSVYRRVEAGHWEVDTVVSGQGKCKACFATFAERGHGIT